MKYSIGSPAWDVKFSPIGYYFATANMDGSAFMYSVDREAPIRIMLGHTSDVTSIAWNENVNYFLTGSEDKTCRLWDIRSGKCARIFHGCASAVSSTAFAPFGNMVAAGTENGAIYTWNVGSGARLGVLNGHEGAINSLSFSSGSDTIASGGSDCSLRIWDLSLIRSNIHAALNAPTDVVNGNLKINPVTIHSTHTYHTKFTPIYSMRHSPLDLIFAGGPFSKEMTGGKLCFSCIYYANMFLKVLFIIITINSLYPIINPFINLSLCFPLSLSPPGHPSLDRSLASASESDAAFALGLSAPRPII